ncbi:MAG: metallophosphoesterase [Gemmatimonadaceae bacterium]
MNRRQFLTRTGLSAGVVAAGAAYWKIELHNLEVVELILPIVGLPMSLDGKRLVQLSDLHVGDEVDPEYVRRSFRLASSLKPDIVAFTGDFITWRGGEQINQLEYVLQDMPRGVIATVGILGNHDYGSDWHQPEVAQSVIDHVSRHGVQFMRNSVQVIEGLSIIGLDDLWAGATNIGAARALVKSNDPSLVLCHNPDVADFPQWQGYRGWMLSGHTHGGQCKFPFLPPPVLPVRNKRYAAGQVELAGGRTVYINRGIGHTLPIRVNVRPEISSFRLVRA